MRSTGQRIRRTLLWLQTAWSILGLTLLLTVLLELGLTGAFWLKDLGKPRIPPDPRVIAAIPRAADWLPVHYRELEALSDRWQPYVYFRQRPFRGRTITIDAEGSRSTWQPPDAARATEPANPPLRILMLGGSSLWGFGARDDQTIPSLIARGLHERGIRVEIRNLAEIGHVSTQEVVALVRELQRGYRPDLVLFYDGVNDTTSALLERQATVTTNEINRVREFNLLQSPGRLAGALAGNLVRNSAMFRLAGTISRRILDQQDAYRRESSLSDAERASLAQGVVQGYLANMVLVEALGRAYGFRAVFVWQPDIFSKTSLVPFEEEEARKFGWARSMFLKVHEILGKDPRVTSAADFRDLSGLFRDKESLAFLDFCHTTESANSEIAKTLVQVLVNVIGRARPGERPGHDAAPAHGPKARAE
jgi:lysophospholipase L1-like esterase